ncbi:unnamed protein product, partial [Allacma fusca]
FLLWIQVYTKHVNQMSPIKATSFFTLAAILVGTVLGQLHSYQDKCEVGKTADNRVLDTCDTQKFLKCSDSRCQCADPKNQIWEATLVKVNSRTKRGKGGKSKGGFGKGVATGAIAGAAGGYLAGRVVSGGGGGGGGSSSKKEKYTKYYSCYSRVGGSCMLENADRVLVTVNKPVELPAAPVTTNVTTENPAPASTDANTTAAAPVAAAQTSQITYDILSLAKCVENAVCLRVEVKIVNGTVVSGGNGDPRVGACQCKRGYKPNSRDVCVVESGVGRQSEVGLFLTFASVIVTVVYANF